MNMDVVGIDLGTTYSAVARVGDGRAAVVRNAQGQPTTPSVIYFPGPGEPPVIGRPAKVMQEAGDLDVACFFKRRMGTPNFTLEFHGVSYTAADLSAILLRQLLEETLGQPRARAVITVPAYFDNHARTATLLAGQKAGIDVLGIVNEPTAAAIAFGLREDRAQKTAVVYDLGGGTFDVTIIKLDRDDITVLGSDGDHELGGKDWDERLIRFVAGQFAGEFGVNPLDDPLACLALGVRCEVAKQQLSAQTKTQIKIDLAGHRGIYPITREMFEEFSRDLVERTLDLVDRALASVKLGWGDIDELVPVGGSTRMPAIQQALRGRFSGKFAVGVDPDEAVALGAALEAERRAAGSGTLGLAGAVRLRDVMAHSLGMVAENQDRSRYINSIIVPKNTPIPSREVRPFRQRTVRGQLGESEVYVLQGESERPRECTVLGKYTISEVAHEASGLAVLDISYRYDENGVVNIEATQRSTGRTLPIRVDPLPEKLEWMEGQPTDFDVVQVQPLAVFLVVDLSGSMSGEPLARSQEAARGFVRQLDLTTAFVGLNIFADQTSTTVELCQSARKLIADIDDWSIGAVGGGNSAHPFHELYPRLKEVAGRRFVVVLTDGVWSRKCSKDALHAAQRLKDDGVEIVALGFGGADQGFLEKLANSSEGALLTRLDDLGAQFSRIAQVMTQAQGTGVAAKSGGGLRFFR